MDRNEDIAGLNFAFIPFGFDFRNPQPDQPARDAAHGRSDRNSAQGRHNWSGGNERSDPWNCHGADAGDPSQRSADDAACAGAGDRAFRGLRVLLVREIAGGVLVREQHGDIIVGEVCGLELTDNLISLITRGGDTEYRFL